MGKMIVMHHNPDLDAIGAGWLLVRFLSSEYGDASFAFVPAGQTYRNQVVDIDPDIVHVDTGGGRFDHHDSQRTELSATVLVYKYLVERQPHLAEDRALALLVDVVNDVDHFGEYYWPDSLNPRYAFMLSAIIPALHSLGRWSNDEVVEKCFDYMDAVYQVLKDFIHSEEEIEEGVEFDSKFGKGIALISGSDNVMKVAQMKGYRVVVRRDKRTGFMKIKTVPEKGVDLSDLYDKIRNVESDGRWYYHPSGHMLINGSSKNSAVRPTKLDIKQVVNMIQNMN